MIDVLDAFVVTGLVKSKGDARRLLQQGGLVREREKLSPDDSGALAPSDAIHGGSTTCSARARGNCDR